MTKKSNNNLNTDNKIGNDKLEEYLVAYDEESIQKIRDEKMQLVTANEFFGLHQEKLAAERKIPITKRDLAVLTAYTGYMFGEFQNFHSYAEEIVGYPILTHQFGDKQIDEKLHELSKEDFLKLHEKLIRESEITDIV
jgi:hypothetical protein